MQKEQMMDAYTTLFNSITDALKVLEDIQLSKSAQEAQTILIQAQQRAEEIFIELPDDQGKNSLPT